MLVYLANLPPGSVFEREKKRIETTKSTFVLMRSKGSLMMRCILFSGIRFSSARKSAQLLRIYQTRLAEDWMDLICSDKVALGL
mmetsp:Transcript_13552/g.17551  ORF Transcript_13552/g.17551 Transcript_13552/m.17551 type:complete len:84 (-) Transcript_13552:39-290(-)